MRILHLNTERTWRGGEQQTLYLLRELAARGVASHLVCQPGSPMAERAADAGVAVCPVRMRGELDLAAAGRIRAIIRRLGCRILHAHTSHAHTLAFWASIGLGVRRLVTRRVDFSIFRHSFLHLSGIKYRFMADRYIAISSRIRDVLVADGLSPGRIALVPSGVDPERFSGEGAERLRDEFAIRPAEPVVINVAHLAPHKGQRHLIEAVPLVLEKVPSARFFIVGEGALKEELAALAGRLAIGERLAFTGFRPDVGAFYRAADLFAMSSVEEGLGTAVLDALALGVPVVAAASGGIPEIVRDGVTGRLVPPADARALADGIVELLTERPLAARLAAAGRSLVLREYTAEAMAARTLAVYSELLSGSA